MSIDREPALPRVLNRPAEVDTPCLLLDLDALERNIDTMAEFVASCGVRLRAHAKTHKSPDIAALQVETRRDRHLLPESQRSRSDDGRRRARRARVQRNREPAHD